MKADNFEYAHCCNGLRSDCCTVHSHNSPVISEVANREPNGQSKSPYNVNNVSWLYWDGPIDIEDCFSVGGDKKRENVQHT